VKSGSAPTAGDSTSVLPDSDEEQPGVVVIHSGPAPMLEARPIGAGQRVVLGRDAGGFELPDERISREHVAVSFDEGLFVLEDLGSRNGTFVDGVAIEGQLRTPPVRVIRAGQTLAFLDRNVGRFFGASIAVSEAGVVGPTLRAALDQIARAAQVSPTLLILGESGSGKEMAARAFHRAGPHQAGPFVPVNCAAIPEGVAERLLFGARKGAFSGADDAEGYVQAADRGVLFLDEVGELDLAVQAKLLRFVETREVLPLGASTPRTINLRLVAATHRDLRESVAAGSFRADLYYRLAASLVHLPALRERPEDVPWLAARELSRVSPVLRPHVKLIEACLLRSWPGNVRELLGELRQAAERAAADKSEVVRAQHLSATAGAAVAPSAAERPGSDARGSAAPGKDAIIAALAAHKGNIAATARALNLHRTQLYRAMKKHGIEGD
jgi:DNA-binding NtrC family response regulator